MKQLPLIASTLYCQPWCILPESHAELGRLYRSYVEGTLPVVPEVLHGSKQVSSGIGYEVDSESGVALLTVEGIISKRTPDMLCGPKIADLSKLDVLLKDIANDQHIQTVVMYLETPGGCGLGLQETTDNIKDVIAAGKRVVAYTDFQCCSAGYWLAAACQEIYAAPSAAVGSIGVYFAAMDDTRAWEMEGLKLKFWKDGKFKGMGHPGKEWTEEEEAHMEEAKNKWSKRFKDHVRAHRNGVEDETMQGQSFNADSAPAGLVDGLHRDLQTVLVAEIERIS